MSARRPAAPAGLGRAPSEALPDALSASNTRVRSLPITYPPSNRPQITNPASIRRSAGTQKSPSNLHHPLPLLQVEGPKCLEQQDRNDSSIAEISPEITLREASAASRSEMRPALKIRLAIQHGNHHFASSPDRRHVRGPDTPICTQKNRSIAEISPEITVRKASAANLPQRRPSAGPRPRCRSRVRERSRASSRSAGSQPARVPSEAVSPRAVPRLPPRFQPLGWLAPH